MKPDRIGLSVPFLCLLLLFLLYEKSGRGTVMLAAALLHEGGHLLAMAWLECRPQKIVFGSFGVRIERGEQLDLGYYKEMLIYAAGPMVNLVCALLFRDQPQVRAIHLALGLFNLLPLGCLDGGQLLGCLLRQSDAPFYWEGAQKILSAVLAAAVLLLGILYARENLSLLLTGCYLLWNLLGEEGGLRV